ncbi:MAG: response regulator [Acidimicrobiales bacterium]
MAVAQMSTSPTGGTAGELPQPRILMVDDRPDALLALEAVLEPLGAELVAARSGIEALQELLAGDFALIILDVQMPEMDGFETARLIRQRERCRYIPIVFLTAISGEPQHFMAGYEAGAFDYLYKPYDPALLRAKVKVLLGLWSKDVLIGRQHAELAAQLAQLERANETVQHQAEELERSNAALQRVAEAAAAGLRRPLSQAIGFLQLAAGAEGGVDRDLTLQATECVARARARLDEVRVAARARPAATGGSRADLRSIMAAVAPKLAGEFPGCQFETPDLPELTGDPRLLGRLLHELLATAAKRPGVANVSLGAEADRDAWRLVVTDDGPPPTPSDLVKGLTSFGKGEGAGSWNLARRLAERCGGTIGAQAGSCQDAQGAVIWVRLPASERGGAGGEDEGG